MCGAVPAIIGGSRRRDRICAAGRYNAASFRAPLIPYRQRLSCPNPLMSPDFWVAVLQIIMIDIVLSGDNAVVIALACRNLPPEQRKRGIFWGGRARSGCVSC